MFKSSCSLFRRTLCGTIRTIIEEKYMVKTFTFPCDTKDSFTCSSFKAAASTTASWFSFCSRWCHSSHLDFPNFKCSQILFLGQLTYCLLPIFASVWGLMVSM